MRVEHPRLIARGIAGAERRGGLERIPGRDVADPEVVGRGLVGDHVGNDTPAHQLGQHLGDVADQSDRERRRCGSGRSRPARAPRRDRCRSGRSSRCPPAAGSGSRSTSTPRKAAPFIVAASGWAPPIPPSPPVTTSRPASDAAEVLPGALGEGLVGALQDSLGADVDPAAGGHLAVHGEAQRVEPAEFVPGGPAGHQVGVGDQDPGRLLVGPEDAHRLAALDQQGLVVVQPAEGGDDPVVALPVARGLPSPAVDDQLLGPLGDVRIEVVHQHPEGGLLVPALAAESGAPGSADDAG